MSDKTMTASEAVESMNRLFSDMDERYAGPLLEMMAEALLNYLLDHDGSHPCLIDDLTDFISDLKAERETNENRP
jgi:hypothetical protein